jgi:hypothetical protein
MGLLLLLTNNLPLIVAPLLSNFVERELILLFPLLVVLLPFFFSLLLVFGVNQEDIVGI